MKRLTLLLVTTCLLNPYAWAQPELEAFRGLKPSTRPVCEQRCKGGEFPDNPRTIEHQTNMAQIRYQKKLETDPDKLKSLAQQEVQLMERRERFIGRLCTQVCSHNPEN